MYWLFFFFCVSPLWIFGHDLEVHLATQSSLTPVYLSRLHSTSPGEGPFLEELRSVLEFDLNANGLTTLISPSDEDEIGLTWPDVRAHFNRTAWGNKHIPYVLAIQVLQNRFQLTAFDIEKGTSKKYPEFALTGRLDEDRKQIHRLADRCR